MQQRLWNATSINIPKHAVIAKTKTPQSLKTIMKTIPVMLTKTVFQPTRQVPHLLCLALFGLLALMTSRASAGIAVVDTLWMQNQGSTGTTNFSLPFLTTGGNVLVVNLNFRPPTSTLPVGPTELLWVSGYGTVTQALTKVVDTYSGTGGANNRGHQIWYLYNPVNDSSGTIQGTYTGIQRRQVLSAYTLSGVDTNVTPIGAFSPTNTSTATPTTTNDLGAVPLGGFAVLNSTSTGATGVQSPVLITSFTANPPGSGATVSSNLVSNVGNTPPNYDAATWVHGYIPALISTVTNFSITYDLTAQANLVGAIFSPAASTSPTPAVIAPSATFTNTSAMLGAIVVTNGGSAITNYGIVYAQYYFNPDPEVGGPFVTRLVAGTSDTLGAFTANATGLTPGTPYSYRGYAQNASGIGYSPVGTFYTLENEPTTQATSVTITNVQQSYFTLNWTRGNGARLPCQD